MRIQLSIKFGACSYTQNGFPSKTILNLKRAWRAHFLSHTHETQEFCCFLAYVQIILVSLFEFSNYLEVAKNAGAFLSRCSELLDLGYHLSCCLLGPGLLLVRLCLIWLSLIRLLLPLIVYSTKSYLSVF